MERQGNEIGSVELKYFGSRRFRYLAVDACTSINYAVTFQYELVKEQAAAMREQYEKQLAQKPGAPAASSREELVAEVHVDV